MAFPIRSIPKTPGGVRHAAADPLDALAVELHGVLASDRRPRLAKARVGQWVRALLDTPVLVPDFTYGYVEDLHVVLDHLITAWFCRQFQVPERVRKVPSLRQRPARRPRLPTP